MGFTVTAIAAAGPALVTVMAVTAALLVSAMEVAVSDKTPSDRTLTGAV